MMLVSEFVSTALDIANNYKTLYVMGCFGAPLTGANVTRYCTNHNYNKQASRTAMIKAAGNQNPPVYGFDCVGLIKGILWGWSGKSTATYGGATYASEKVPDIGANSMLDVCGSTISINFSKISPGAVVGMPDHIGIYVGDGKVVECTPKWKNCVQITNLSDREWVRWGLLPYVDYSSQSVTVENIPDWMEPYKDTLVRAKELGISDCLNLDRTCTRGETILMMMRVYDKLKGGS